MKQLDVENQLRDVVSRIILQVELATAQGRTDINLALEDAFIPILRSVYNLPHLVNLNRKQKNFPGIDLGDDHDRVAFQITATTSLEKVKFTLKQFMDRRYFNTFDEVYILMLTKKQGSYSQTSVNEIVGGDFSFNCKKHIIDLSDLLGEVAGLRLAAQERVLSEFKHVLGEVDAYISYSTESIAAPLAVTSNLQRIELPGAIYVADLTIDEKEVVHRARAELGYKGKVPSKKSIVKMALLLAGEGSDAWVCYEGRLFSFQDIENSGLSNVVDVASAERLEVSDLAASTETDNVNLLKQLLFSETQERLKAHDVRTHKLDRFFFFGPNEDGQQMRKETWIGKKSAIRRVYEVKYQKKDPTKIAHYRHLSFELGFIRVESAWFAQIVPSWYFSYDGYLRSNWHEDLLSQQKRLEFNSSVRNQVRFVAYFLGKTTEGLEDGLRFAGLVEFNVREEDAEDPADDVDADDGFEAGEQAA